MKKKLLSLIICAHAACILFTACSNHQPPTMKVSDEMPAEIKLLLHNKTLKEGENKFKLNSGYYLNFIITNGQFHKCVLLSDIQSTAMVADLTTARKRNSTTPALSACAIQYAMCMARCGEHQSSVSTGNPAPCENQCEIDRFNCDRGVTGRPGGVVIE